MTERFSASRVKAILLDIEGTTTPISFVHDVLFPFARARVQGYLGAHGSDESVIADVAALRAEHEAELGKGLVPPRWVDEPRDAAIGSAAAYVHWLMDRDRKSTALKSIQGRIWEEGYRSGKLSGQVFHDVPPALERWHARKLDVCIFSSGSVLAQKLLFAHTDHGDLTRSVREYFDTRTGPKTATESYRRIAAQLRLELPDVLFISDVTAELDAARAAGMQSLLCVRAGNHPQPAGHGHSEIHSFDEL